ncbi:MAG: thermonuclease family protein [Rhizobiaceae bacterium]
MSTPRRIALFLVGAALIAALWFGTQSLRQSPVPAPQPVTSKAIAPAPVEAPPASSSRQPASRGNSEVSGIRVIAKGSIPGPEIDGPLERVAPREPLTAATEPLKREAFGPPVPQGTLLYQPLAKSAGEFEAGGYTVRLAGIEVTPPDRTCADEDRPTWPCGIVARTAFRAWMRGRAVACDVPSHPAKITTHCMLDGEDMALWLVRNGWAGSADGQYDAAEAKARRDRKGIFGPSPLAAKE